MRTMNELQLWSGQLRFEDREDTGSYLPSFPSQYCEGAKENGLGIAVAEVVTDEEVMARTSRTVKSTCFVKAYRDRASHTSNSGTSKDRDQKQSYSMLCKSIGQSERQRKESKEMRMTASGELKRKRSGRNWYIYNTA